MTRTAEERARFEEENKRVHPVETQWHYPHLVKYGFEPETKEAVGFVRSYDYINATGRRIRCSTGYSADHWRDLETQQMGYWSDLDAHLENEV